MHDFLYAFGFDENDGNFQVNNFGNGGTGNDPVLAEASDGYEDGIVFNCGGPPPTRRCVNNANFNTPADGASPRMQMFMWESPDRDGCSTATSSPTSTVTVSPSGSSATARSARACGRRDGRGLG